jgi:hypothetical protein
MLIYLRGYFENPERIRRLKRPSMYKVRSTDMLSTLRSIPEDQILSNMSSSRENDLNRRKCA